MKRHIEAHSRRKAYNCVQCNKSCSFMIIMRTRRMRINSQDNEDNVVQQMFEKYINNVTMITLLKKGPNCNTI